MLLMIDNFDSFTFNVVRYFEELGEEVVVYRNNEITVAQIESLNPSRLVISPGPCTPDEAGVSLQAIQYFAGKIPVLGICLGHQCIGQVFGGQVIRAQQVMHGKNSLIQHSNQGLFSELEQPLDVTRYHSLVVEMDSLPDDLEVTAWTTDGFGNVCEVMGIRHKKLEVHGVQFHPEAVLTRQGHALLANFLNV